MNQEEQYSIWPVDRENPFGWRNADKSGTRTECLAHIDEVWTDMRPLSLRKEMEQPEGTMNQVWEELPIGSFTANTDKTDVRLADYKVPSQVLLVTEISKGQTGKLQRIGLAETFAADLRPDYEAPSTAAEAALARIWEEVLAWSRSVPPTTSSRWAATLSWPPRSSRGHGPASRSSYPCCRSFESPRLPARQPSSRR